MAINLQEIRSAVISYVDTKVTVSLSEAAPVGGAGDIIGPKEDFNFSIAATNADAAAGGIPLKNLIWHVWIEDDKVAKLYVPFWPTSAVRSGLKSDSPSLKVGALVGEMYIHNLPWPGLGVGQTYTAILKGKAGGEPSGGTSGVGLKIYADIDVDWLFPKGQDTFPVDGKVVVKG
jgi:hypothetical protein